MRSTIYFVYDMHGVIRTTDKASVVTSGKLNHNEPPHVTVLTKKLRRTPLITTDQQSLPNDTEHLPVSLCAHCLT
jgi:hypothetical protein